MKSFKKLLMFILLFPILPIFGVEGGAAGGEGTGGEGQGGGKSGTEGGGSGEGSASGGEGAGKGQEKLLDQKAVDAIVQDRLKRARTKLEKDFTKQLDDLKKQFTAGGDGEGNANAGGQALTPEQVAAVQAQAAQA